MNPRYLQITVALLAMLSSCSAAIEKSAEEEEFIKASFTIDETTKTVLDEGKVIWEEGDAVKVHYANSGNDYRFTLCSDPQSKAACFQGMIKASDKTNQIEGVMYPYTDLASYWWIYWSHVQIPSEQEFRNSSFASGTNPSVGRVSNGRATFYNVAGLIQMHISGDVPISKVRIQSLAGETLSGMYKYNVSDTIKLESTESGVSTVTLSAANKAIDISSGCDFIFVVAPTTLTKGISVTFCNESDESFTSLIEEPIVVRRARKTHIGNFVLSSTEFKKADPMNSNLIVNGDFSTEVPSHRYDYPVDKEWRVAEGWTSSEGVTNLYWAPTSGIDGSACVAIDSPDNYCDTGFSQVVTGLEPDAPYIFSCMVKTENIPDKSSSGYDSSGAGLAVVVDDITWPIKSEAQYGSSDWHEVKVEFEPVSKTAILRLKLGGTASDAKGRVWFDNASLSYNSGMYIRQSEHLRVLVEREYYEKSSISDEEINTWLSNLDHIYDQYSRLFKGKVPFGGKFITFRSATINAWAYAGNPVQWNRNHITSTFNSIARGDWCFGLMHELGHNFAPYISNATYAWNFNEELFANFRMFYAIDHIGNEATVINNAGSLNEKTYHGREITGLYYSDTDNCYLNTLAKGRAVEMGNALTWCFVRMVDEFGWQLWEDTFEELYNIPSDAIDTTGWTQWDKFQCLIAYLNKHVPEGRNVIETFPEGELDIIEKYLSTQQ